MYTGRSAQLKQDSPSPRQPPRRPRRLQVEPTRKPIDIKDLPREKQAGGDF